MLFPCPMISFKIQSLKDTGHIQQPKPASYAIFLEWLNKMNAPNPIIWIYVDDDNDTQS